MAIQEANEIESAVRWFLRSDDGLSTIRIAPGLALTEDETGEVLLELHDGPDTLVRFDIEGDDLWLTVVSPDWALAGIGKSPTDRLRLKPHMELNLPHNRFRVTDNLSSDPAGTPISLQLVPCERDGRRAAPAAASQPETSGSPAAARQPEPPHEPAAAAREPAAAGRPARSPATTPAPAQVAKRVFTYWGPTDTEPPESKEISSAWRWLMPDRQPMAGAPAAAAGRSRDQPGEALAADVQWAPDPPPRQPMPVHPEPASPLMTLPRARQMRHRSSPAPRRIRAHRRQRYVAAHRGYRLVMAAFALAVLMITSPANTPVEDDLITTERLLAASGEPIQPMLDEVEALIRGDRINDPASLQFAVEAYRMAVRYGHHDAAQADRLAELEERLAKVAAR
jgi:hypothetical protein